MGGRIRWRCEHRVSQCVSNPDVSLPSTEIFVSIGTGQGVRQFGGRGMFAIVTVEATTIASGLTVSIDAPVMLSGGARYVPAVTAGIRYAWEQLECLKRGDGASINVLEIMPLSVDTTEMTMLYAAALGAWNALQLSPERPIVLDPETRRISFSI